VSVTIEEIKADQFPLYDGIPTWFEVKSMFRVEVIEAGLGGFRLVEEEVAEPFIRDYNSHNEDNPTRWASRFDVSQWGIFLAMDDEGQLVGGATVAIDAPVYPLDRFQRQDLAVLWDIRVHPEYRGQGIGSQLFRYAVEWARGKGYGQLGMETDSSNVAACRFYAGQGCKLGAIHRFGYIGVPEVAHNAMLLWYLDL
jgi:ribosomal protein S18 acetylase RimI-like enzyme